MKKPLVFISHKSTQSRFVTALVTLLESCGFTNENLFCSSVPGFYVGLDEDLIETLRKKFLEYDLYVLFVLSSDYFQSAYCLNEMGAAWVLKSDNSIILTPGTDESMIQGVIDKDRIRISFQSIDQVTRARMIELRNKLLDFAGLPKVSEINWNRYYDSFVQQIGLGDNAKKEVIQSGVRESSQINAIDPDKAIMDAINELGRFSFNDLLKRTGIKSIAYLRRKLDALVQSGALIAEGPYSNKYYRVKTS